MAYRNKTYVVFDADTDIQYYRTLQMWKANESIDFDFYDAHDLNNLRDGSSEDTIKRKLRKRMANAKILVVLVGENTRYLYKYVRWEIEIAIAAEIPIVVTNINCKRIFDDDRCPAILDKELALHISFKSKILQQAFDSWPSNHKSNVEKGKSGPYYFKDSVYERLGLN